MILAELRDVLMNEQKIVIKVQMPSGKCRLKAMKIAITEDGVTKVEIQGKGRDELVVIGNEVDSVRLAQSLRKKLHYAEILSVQEEKEKKDEKKETFLIPYTRYPNHMIPQVVYRGLFYPVPTRLKCVSCCLYVVNKHEIV